MFGVGKSKERKNETITTNHYGGPFIKFCPASGQVNRKQSFQISKTLESIVEVQQRNSSTDHRIENSAVPRGSK